MIDFMVELWTNFATYHDPTPLDHIWSASKDNSYVRLVDSKVIADMDPFREERLQFWKNFNK